MRKSRPCLVAWFFGCVSLLTALPASGGEIGYIEEFALAPDRAAALKQLVPGAENYYYFYSLYYQQNEQFDRVDELLKAWGQRYGETPLLKEIRTRQALLTYSRSPDKTLAYLRQRLNLPLNHQKEQLDVEPAFPTKLDPATVTRQAFADRAFAQANDHLNGFEPSALDWLAARDLNPNQRRNLLSRLDRPDHPRLVKLIADDLAHVNSGGFGSLGIHAALMRGQLDDLAQLRPQLLNEQKFVQAYLKRLEPTDDEDWRADPNVLAAYLDRLQAFAQRLAPVNNSLKALVLYHQLTLDRARGVYDKPRLLAYLKLPRPVPYLSKAMRESDELRRFAADPAQSHGTLLPAIGDDQPLVRSCLAHFLVDAPDTKEFAPYIDDVYLRHLFAETKILAGVGADEQWASLLPAEQFRALRDRVDIHFAYTNKRRFAVDEPVTLDVQLKNVGTLIVRVFEINTGNYYRTKLSEITTDIELDGLTANSEQTVKLDSPPLRRTTRRFEFPQLKGPGVYVVDFIGNGRSSRALIRKGQLTSVSRISSLGHVFTVLDEQQKHVKDARIWLAGQEYSAQENGKILVPFTASPGEQPIVLTAPVAGVEGGEFASLDRFQHANENHELAVGFHVDRESLLTRKTARLVIRPMLTIHGEPVSIKAAENVRLIILGTDLDGVQSRQEIPDVPLYEDRETTHEFQTPTRLASLQFALAVDVKRQSVGGTKVTLSVQHTVNVNSIDRTEKIADLHLLPTSTGYLVELRGKTGEPKASRAIHVRLKHRDVVEPFLTTLKTDAGGRVHLGMLDEIERVEATDMDGVTHSWNLPRNRHTYPRIMQGRAGDALRIPFLPANPSAPLTRDEVSLIEVRSDAFVADRFEHASVREGLLVLDKLPVGDYDLLLKSQGARIRVRVGRGDVVSGYVAGPIRQLETRPIGPPQIESITRSTTKAADGKPATDRLSIQLRNASPFTRVHVFATRYLPQFDAFHNLAAVRDQELSSVRRLAPSSLYLTGRNIGDEYRYILDRRFAPKFPGNSLDRPALLLNPWALRDTQSGWQDLARGERYEQMQDPAGLNSPAAPDSAVPTSATKAEELTSNLDFLPLVSTTLTNLAPNAAGVVELDADVLAGKQFVQVVAVDPAHTTVRTQAFPEVDTPLVDLRFAAGLKPDAHFSSQKRITVARPGQPFVIADTTTGKLEVYDSLARVFGLYSTLTADPNLAEFSFLMEWPNKKDEEKRTLYSKHACHELNVFLARKDPAFFAAVVRPYLANKLAPRFVDQYLLERDLRSYAQPWRHAQLNIAERILLGERVADERTRTARHVGDLLAILPPNVELFHRLFDTAVKRSSLETENDVVEHLGLIVANSVDGAAPQEPKPTSASGAAESAPRSKARLYRNAEFGFGAMGGLGGGGGGGRGGEVQEEAKKVLEDMQRKETLYKEVRSLEERRDRSKLADMGRRDGKAQRPSREGNGVALEAMDKAVELWDNDFDTDGVQNGRAAVRQFYRQLEATKEWAENDYYQLPISEQNEGLITVNAFWNDYAQRDPAQPFLSRHFAEASRNFAEMMLALSVLDLPFQSPKHEIKVEGTRMTLSPQSPLIVFHEEIQPAAAPVGPAKVLVSQNFFALNDRYRQVNGEQIDHFVRDEFLVHTVYGGQIVVTNPTSARQRLSLLVQIPVGALPVLNTQPTKTIPVDLAPYNTTTVEFHFYFPAAGRFAHFPVHAAQGNDLIAFAAPTPFTVVEKPTRVDTQSWDYVSQHGTDQQVLEMLDRDNVSRLNLERIAWRMRDPKMFQAVIDRLARRHVYHHALWAYSLLHNAAPAAREFLQHENDLVAECGGRLTSPLLDINPVERHEYQHLEYKPLVNARAHVLGARRQIVNDAVLEQYHSFLKELSYERTINAADRSALTYYLLLQDRVDEALAAFKLVDANAVPTRIQYDYCAAYLAFFTEETDKARKIAAGYAKHPVDRWRNAFAGILAQLDEIDGKGTTTVDAEDRSQQQTQLAASEPSIELSVENNELKIAHQNVKRVRVNYYEVDAELMFSRTPFAGQARDEASFIRPSLGTWVDLPADKQSTNVRLPDAVRGRNVIIEVVGGGKTRSLAHYAHTMTVQMIENYGQLRVTQQATGKPVPKAYVKVYARMADGQVKFYKDGYTDLRGRFDYASLSTDDLETAARFALLIVSEEHGSTVREAGLPAR